MFHPWSTWKLSNPIHGDLGDDRRQSSVDDGRSNVFRRRARQVSTLLELHFHDYCRHGLEEQPLRPPLAKQLGPLALAGGARLEEQPLRPPLAKQLGPLALAGGAHRWGR